jgi:hypothetical protein
MATSLGVATPLVLVQQMVTGTVVLVAGIVHGQLFGPGHDRPGRRAHRPLPRHGLPLTPMTDRDAGKMWRSPRVAPLLTGYCGAPAADTAAVEDLLLRLGRW